MKKFKIINKIIIAFLVVLLINVVVLSAVTYKPYLKVNGDNLKYRGSNVNVMIPTEYQEQETDFRAVWVTHLTGDFPAYQSVTQYKNEIQKVLDTMEYFNMNVMIFHVRTHNNALYKSELNPVASYYSSVNFNVFDPLEYIIEESHKRGIEFHAWLNPYRLSSNTGTIESFAARQPSYNIASNPEMILKVNSNQILNPGEPAVRDFIVETSMEIIEKYDIDAIHFDDYFYIEGVDDSLTRAKYNTEGLSTADFRRKQVDLFMEQLYTEMKAYNLANNRLVQLGVSPSGIYRNGSYVAPGNYKYDANGKLTSPLGSNTAGMEHYAGYLFSDSKKWIDEEWIDYIIPQSYWAFEHNVAGFADVMDWWNGVVKYSKVNLYAGMGIYMSGSGNFSWSTHDNEALNQVIYTSALDKVQGTSLFSYKHIRAAYNNPTGGVLERNLTNMKNGAWTSYPLLPEIRTYNKVTLPKTEILQIGLKNNKTELSFSKVDGAKFYVVYRDQNEINFSNEQILAVFSSSDEVVKYVDNTTTLYKYGIKAMSNTNSLGAGATVTNIGTVLPKDIFTIWFYVDNVLHSTSTSNNVVLPSIPAKDGYDQAIPYWSKVDFSDIEADTRVDAIYKVNEYTVEFYDKDDNLIKTEIVEYGKNATAPTIPDVEGYEFVGWDKEFTNVSEDLTVKANYEAKIYYVAFYDKDNKLIELVEVSHGNSAQAPNAPEVDGFEFVGWDRDIDEVTHDMGVYAIYEEAEEVEPVDPVEKDDPEEEKKPLFSCKGINFGIIAFVLSYGLYIFFRRRK